MNHEKINIMKTPYLDDAIKRHEKALSINMLSDGGKEARNVCKQYKRKLRQTAVMRGFYAVFSTIWVFISPLMFGIVVPFVYHYIIMGKGNTDPAGDSAIVFFVYIVLWFWVHESYIKHKRWFF